MFYVFLDLPYLLDTRVWTIGWGWSVHSWWRNSFSSCHHNPLMPNPPSAWPLPWKHMLHPVLWIVSLLVRWTLTCKIVRAVYNLDGMYTWRQTLSAWSLEHLAPCLVDHRVSSKAKWGGPLSWHYFLQQHSNKPAILALQVVMYQIRIVSFLNNTE